MNEANRKRVMFCGVPMTVAKGSPKLWAKDETMAWHRAAARRDRDNTNAVIEYVLGRPLHSNERASFVHGSTADGEERMRFVRVAELDSAAYWRTAREIEGTARMIEIPHWDAPLGILAEEHDAPAHDARQLELAA